MTDRPCLVRGATILLLAPALLLPAACTTATPPPAPDQSAPRQPATAIYRCGERAQLTVESNGGAVRVSLDGSEPVDLVAAPPGQDSRYGAEGYALVLEGRDALWMKAGKAPLTCTR